MNECTYLGRICTDLVLIDFKEKKQASGVVTEEAPFPPE